MGLLNASLLRRSQTRYDSLYCFNGSMPCYVTVQVGLVVLCMSQPRYGLLYRLNGSVPCYVTAQVRLAVLFQWMCVCYVTAQVRLGVLFNGSVPCYVTAPVWLAVLFQWFCAVLCHSPGMARCIVSMVLCRVMSKPRYGLQCCCYALWYDFHDMSIISLYSIYLYTTASSVVYFIKDRCEPVYVRRCEP